MRLPFRSISESTSAVSAPVALDAIPAAPTHPAPPAAGRRPVSEPPVPTVSRRSVIATLIAAFAPAAGTVVALPAVVKAAAGAASAADHPDAELLELGREYDRVTAAVDAALKHLEDRQAAYDDLKPVPRDVMRHRISDHICQFNLPIGLDTGRLTADVEHAEFYSADEIKLLRYAPPPWNANLIQAQKARANEIGEEWRRWRAECSDFRDTIGLTAAEEAWDVLDDEQQLVVEKIAAASATTFAGLWVRARVLQSLYDELDPDDGWTENHHLLFKAMIRDIGAVAGRSM